MGLIERDEALAALEGLLSDAGNGRGRVAVVAGTVATGKSTLLHTLAEQAIDRGALAITATGSQAEQDVPLGVLAQLVDDAPLGPSERERALDLLAEGTGAAMAARPQAETLEQLDAQIVHALCTVLLELSERHPLLIVVDDVHHADRASLLCLAYLCRRLRFARMVAVFSVADHGQYGESFFQTELQRQPHCRRINLPLLSREGGAELVTGLLGDDHAREGWFELSGGNPLLLQGLVEDYLDERRSSGAEPTGVVAGDRYGQAVLSCLHRAGRPMLDLARGLAVGGEVRSLDQLLGLSSGEVAQRVHMLTVAGILSRDGFRHPRAASAVVAELGLSERSTLFRRAAELAYNSGAAATVIADHLLQAEETTTPWAVPVLEDAARQALRDGRVEQAVAYLKLAWQACTDEQHRVKITTALVRAEWRINPSASTGHFPELTDAMHRGMLQGYPAVVLAKALLWHGRFEEAQAVLVHVGDAGGDLDQEALAELITAKSWLRSSYPPFLAHLRRSMRDQGPLTISSVAANRRREAAAALASVLTKGPGDELLAAAERILRSSRLDEGSLDTVESAVLTLTYGGAADSAGPWCDTFMEEAVTRRAPSRQARLAAVRAEIAFRQGDLPRAELHAKMALEIMPHTSWGVAVGGPLGTLVLAATAMGKHTEVADHLDRPVPDAMFQTRYGLHYLHARGRYSLATDHPRPAFADFQLCGQLMEQWGLDVPGMIPWRADAAEACLRMNKPGQARRLIEDQLARCGSSAPRVHGISMRLLAATSELRHRPMLLRQAADLLQSPAGDVYELARALFDLTEAYHALGEYRRAGMIGRRAKAVAQECQASTLVRALTRENLEEPSPGESPEVSPILSDAERRVAALAAVGYTNREIADKLYVTVSTVEQHLTRTYRKLNITRRADLPASVELIGSVIA